jgi:hypothetical protein
MIDHLPRNSASKRELGSVEGFAVWSQFFREYHSRKQGFPTDYYGNVKL